MAGSDVRFEASGETEMPGAPKGFETGAAPRSPAPGSVLSAVGRLVQKQFTELRDGNGNFLPK